MKNIIDTSALAIEAIKSVFSNPAPASISIENDPEKLASNAINAVASLDLGQAEGIGSTEQTNTAVVL